MDHRLLVRRVDLGAQDAHEAQVAVALAVVEPVADDELVGDLEAHVVHRDVHEAPRGLVEQGADPERGRALAAQVADEVVERQPGVDDVLDEQDVLVGDAADRSFMIRTRPDDSVAVPPYELTSMRSIRSGSGICA